MRICRSHILFVFMMLGSYLASAQVTVRAFTDKTQILIGESINLTLQAYLPLGEKGSGFQVDSIEHFTILGVSKVDTSRSADLVTLSQTFKITSFDSGRWQIPSFQYTAGNANYQTDSIGVDVSFSEFDPKEDYREIKSIETVEDNRNDKLPWIIGITCILALVGFYYFFRNKKPGVSVPKGKPRLSPYNEAIEALDRLAKQTDMQNGAVKEYYSDMNDVLRVYLDRELAEGSIYKTNDELLNGLRQRTLEQQVRVHLEQALRVTDFVKFAKYQPTPDDNKRNLSIIRNAIESLNKQQARGVQVVTGN